MTRQMFLIGISIFLMAFATGDYAELEQLMNGRDSGNFLKSTPNIRFTVPKGTVGKINQIKKFSSGNMGLELELKNHKPGEKVWVYFTPQKPNMKFFKENPLEKPGGPFAEPVVSGHARAETTVPAVQGPSAGPTPRPGEIKAIVKTAIGKMQGLGPSLEGQACLLCEVMVGKEPAQDCESKREQVGNLNVYQSKEGPLCEIYISSADGHKVKWPRRYSFMSDGHYESQDTVGARGAYFFPRKNKVSYSVSADAKTVIVQTTSDVQVHFSTQTGRISHVTNVKSWKEKDYNTDENSPADSEHLKIQPLASNPILDLTYVVSASPERSPARQSVFYYDENKSCKITNSEIFNYHRESDGYLKSVTFKFQKDQDFLNFAKNKCK